MRVAREHILLIRTLVMRLDRCISVGLERVGLIGLGGLELTKVGQTFGR